MKSIIRVLLTVILIGSVAIAAEEHKHKIVPGPKGGKVLEVQPFHAEFFVQSNKKACITFYDADMKPVAPTVQEVKVVAEVKTGKVTLDFEKIGDAFVSKAVLPEGEGYRIVVQIKKDSSAKSQNFRIDYHNELCKECKRAEYACVCEHAEGSGGHAH